MGWKRPRAHLIKLGMMKDVAHFRYSTDSKVSQDVLEPLDI